MALTINFTLFKRKQYKNGRIPIYIRITENRKSRYKSTEIAIEEKHWNDNQQRVRKSHPNYKVLNQELDRLDKKAKNVKLKLQHEERLSLETVKRHLGDDDPNLLSTFCDRYVKGLKEADRVWDGRHYATTVRNIKAYCGERDPSLKDIDSEFLENFQEYLLNEVGNAPNTVRKKLQRFRTMIKHAIKEKRLSKDPFLNFEKVSSEPVRRTRLTLEQIRQIENANLKEGSDLWHTRNYFLFSFYNAGIRFGDLCRLTWQNIVDNRLKYTMAKSGSHKSIKLTNPAQSILNRYRKGQQDETDFIFPLLDEKVDYSDEHFLKQRISSCNAKVNSWLKDLAEKANISENISFHIARHSFADLARRKGMDVYDIKNALGHSDISVTQEYLESFDEESLDDSMDELFN